MPLRTPLSARLPTGARLRSLRAKANMSQREVAEATSISEATISNAERGMRTAKALAIESYLLKVAGGRA